MGMVRDFQAFKFSFLHSQATVSPNGSTKMLLIPTPLTYYSHREGHKGIYKALKDLGETISKYIDVSSL